MSILIPKFIIMMFSNIYIANLLLKLMLYIGVYGTAIYRVVLGIIVFFEKLSIILEMWPSLWGLLSLGESSKEICSIYNKSLLEGGLHFLSWSLKKEINKGQVQRAPPLGILLRQSKDPLSLGLPLFQCNLPFTVPAILWCGNCSTSSHQLGTSRTLELALLGSKPALWP